MTEMKKHINRFFVKPIIKLISFIINMVVPKDRMTVIFHGSTLERYNENTRYLYEYLSQKPDIKPVWATNSPEILDHLSGKGMNVVKHRSLKGYISYLTAGVVIGNGNNYPDFLDAVGAGTVKISLWHGAGPRSTNAAGGVRFSSSLDLVKKLHDFSYINFTSEYTASMIGMLQFMLPESKRMVNGYPRCDHLFDKAGIKEKLAAKELAKKCLPEIGERDRLILYSPTWRNTDWDVSFPVKQFSDFNLKELDEFLSDNGLFLLISKHPIVTGSEDFEDCGRIRYIPSDPLFDINLLLPEISMLITDYSSIMTDFAIMDRPMVFVMPDYEETLYKRGLLEDFRSVMPGREAGSMKEFCEVISKYSEAPELDSELRKKHLSKYYDVSITDSSERHYQFLKGLISKKI